MKSCLHCLTAIFGWSFLAVDPLVAQSSAYRGLWVGDATLGAVTEVTVPLDASNVPRAPDPTVATPTSDAASLRLILHVDAAGKVSLLKHVAILARKAGEQGKESDLALVTDPRLYGSFPPQPAQRISSIVFDFGDAHATAAVDEIVKRASAAAAIASAASGATQGTVTSAAQAAAAAVIPQADATAAFALFLQNDLNATEVRKIANGQPSQAGTNAIALRDGSFYGDTRGVEMVNAIEAAVAAMPVTATSAEREQRALNTAAAFADIQLVHDRFLAGETLGDMIDDAAEAAANASDAAELKEITAFQSADGGAAIAATGIGHGLVNNDRIAVLGAAVSSYNGIHAVLKLDDDTFRIAAPFVAGGAIGGYSASENVAPLTVTSAGHGLSDGDRVTLRGSLAGYNGTHLAAVIDSDNFSIDLAFESDPADRGVWSIRAGEITGYEGTGNGSTGLKVLSPGHGLNNGEIIEIQGSSEASYNGPKTITRIDDNSFSIAQAFGGNPATKGSWDIPVPIAGFAPPAELPTAVTAPAHGLASGDRIVISDSGQGDYNAEHVVTVIDNDTFSIPVVFNDETGDPAVKGSWQPASGGQWRKVAPVETAIGQVAKVVQMRAKALSERITAYSDSRAPDAVEMVLDAILLSAVLEDSVLAAQSAYNAGQAGRDALSNTVLRYPRASEAPSLDYDAFIHSTTFTGAVATAASAAATGALEEKANLLATPSSIQDKAAQGAINALGSVYSAASRSLLTELPMAGNFGPGSSGLGTELVVPANHPTNPFRHRRHPDHTTGINIRRLVNLSFLSQDNQPLSRGGYGVDRISGIYDEEIHGLHKPLGPSRNLGLKVRGTFQLHRISLIDTLNGR